MVDVAVETAAAISNRVVLVLPEQCRWDGVEVTQVIAGGESRIDSVSNALQAIPDDDGVVVVHDAAHPLASRATFEKTIEAVRDRGAAAAVPFLGVSDVVKEIHGQALRTLGRDGLGLAQVPMAFALHWLRIAHQSHRASSSPAYEDSELIERSGGKVVAVEGSPLNHHVVTPRDLDLVRLIAASALNE